MASQNKIPLAVAVTVFLLFGALCGTAALAADVGQYNVVNVYAVPPQGDSLGEYPAFVYDADKNSYEPVTVKMVGSNFGSYLHGTFQCPYEENKKKIERECAFLQRMPFDLKNRKALSPLEHEIGRVLSSLNKIEFSPWSRYALSYEECGNTEYFRISLQFGTSATDRLVSVTVPFSDRPEIEYKDMELKSQEPCSGRDVFFTVDALYEILKTSYNYKAPMIEIQGQAGR